MEVGAIDFLVPDHFELECEAYDREVMLTPGIDNFCSSSAWILSAKLGFSRKSVPLLMRGEHGYALLMSQPHPQWGRLLTPLEASWLMASPLISQRPARLVKAFAEELKRDRLAWDTCLLPGFVLESELFNSLVSVLFADYRMYHGPSMTRRIASLEGGLDGFLARRSARFRQNLRRGDRQQAHLPIQFEWVDPLTAGSHWNLLFRRVLAIEDRSWKGLEGHGMNVVRMRRFYRSLMSRQSVKGQIRLGFATLEGQDIGYILGAVVGSVYRGYQFSFDAVYHKLSLGNWMQIQMIQHLCNEGVTFYNLGQDMEYKHHWSELSLETVALVISKL